MTALATDVRTSLAAALDGVIAGHVYTLAVPAPSVPSATIAHGNPWQTPQVVGGILRCEYRMRVLCTVRDDGAHLPDLEQMIEDVARGLPDGWAIDTVTPPASLDTGAQGSVLVAEVLLVGSFQEDPTP